MSDTNTGAHIFRVTNTKTKIEGVYDDEYGYWESYESPEGSLGWALEQALRYSGTETPVILFSKEVSGKTLKLGTEDMDWGTGAYCYGDLIFRLDEGVKPITLSSVKQEKGSPGTPLHYFENLTLEEGISIASDVTLTIDGTLTLNNTQVDGMVYLSGENARIQGEGITFSSSYPLGLELDEHWDGTPEGLHAQLYSKIDTADYRFTAKERVFTVNAGTMSTNGSITGEVVIDEAWKASVLPEGFTDLSLTFSVGSGGHVTIAAGTKLITLTEHNVGYWLNVEEGGTLIIEPGVEFINESDLWFSINNQGGTLQIDGIDLTDIDLSGDMTVTNCWGAGEVIVYNEGENVNLKGCNLSKMGFCIFSYDFDENGNMVIEGNSTLDLSGNYWGTTSTKAIMKKFYTLEYDEYSGYSKEVPIPESYFWSETNTSGFIRIGDALSSAPEKPNLDPPALKLGKSVIANAGEGVADVTLSWSSKSSVTYTLMVDGREVISGTTATSYTLQGIGDGEHSYTVIATKTSTGISSTQAGSFSFDATAPEVTPGDTPTILKPKNGKAQVELSWEGNEAGAKYTVYVDGKKVYSGTKPTCKVNLNDGAHEYSITATDKAGNTSAPVYGEFEFDATAPEVRLAAPSIAYASEGCGKGLVTLHVSSEEGASYKLTLNGKDFALSDPASADIYLGELADGKYKYTVTATDAAGNESKKQSGSFVVDSSDLTPPEAPGFKSAAIKVKGENTSELKLTWVAPEKGTTYVLSGLGPDGSVIDAVAVKSTSYTFKGLTDGTYSFAVSAVDKAGNVGNPLMMSDITIDSIAPVITGLTHEVQNGPVGSKQSTASLSWQGEEAASYFIKLGGKTLTFTRGDEGIYSATLKSGKELITCTLTQGEDGSLTYYHPFMLKDGKYKYSITAIDEAGNKKEYKGAEALVTNTKTAPVAQLATAQLDAELSLSAGACSLPQASTLSVEGSLPGLNTMPEDESYKQGMLA